MEMLTYLAYREIKPQDSRRDFYVLHDHKIFPNIYLLNNLSVFNKEIRNVVFLSKALRDMSSIPQYVRIFMCI